MKTMNENSLKNKIPAYMKYAKNIAVSWNDPTAILKPSDLNKPLIDIVADDYPMIIEYNNIKDNSYQINSIVDKDSPLFQPSPNIVVFKDYSPYTIHENKICFRNNDSVARRLKIIQPDSVFFEVSALRLANGEPLKQSKIASGMEVCVIVKFKPQEVRDYSIDLVVSTEREKFLVPVRAVGLRPFLVIPDEIDFGLCPIKTPTRKSILVQNTGLAPAQFIITSKNPVFTCPSEEIIIDVNGSKMLEFYFTPKSTLMSISEFEISFTKGPKCYIKLIGSGKNVEVNLSTNNLILDSCYISLFSEKSITINNNSNLPIQFSWKSFSIDNDDVIERERIINDINELESTELNNLSLKISNGDYNILSNIIPEEIDFDIDDNIPLVAKADEAAIIRKYRNLRQDAINDKLLYIDSIFELSPIEGTIWANSSLEISIVFRPDIAAMFSSTAYLDISGRQDRLPLHLSGTGIGPHATLSFEQLDIGDIFINQTQSYPLQIINKGDIPAVYNYIPTHLTKFSNSFEFTPSNGTILPGNTETIMISFLSTYLGEFNEKFLFSLQGNEELLSCLIKGHVIGPTFHFSSLKLNFNIVSYDYLHTQIVRLTNTSSINMNYYLYIPQDNGLKKEFNIDPNSGILLPQQYVDISIEFIPLTVKIFNYSLNIDIIGVGNNLFALPIYAECKIGSLQLFPRDIDFGECFIRYPYFKQVKISNLSHEVNTKFEVLPQFQYTKSIGSFEVEPSIAVIEPNDFMLISMRLVGLRLGQNKIPYQISIAGSTEPPSQGSITFTAIGPKITTNVTELRYGNIECLKDISLPLIVTNESLITSSMKIFLKMARSKYSIKDNIYELILQANESKTIDILANLDDTIICKDELHIIVEEGDDIMIPLSSKGVGTTIYSGLDLKHIDLGIQLTNQTFEKAILLENKGKRPQFLKWTNLTITNENNKNLQEIKKLNKKEKLLKIPKHLLPVESIYTMYPTEITLRPRTAVSFILKGFSSIPGNFSETFQLESRIGKERNMKQITETVISTIIVNPLLSISESYVSFNYTWVKGIEPTIQSKSITLTNSIDIPLTFVLRTEIPFNLSSWEHTLHPNQSIDIVIYFDPLYKDNKESHTVNKSITISYKNHPQIDTVTLNGEINFPNLQFDKSNSINFGIILNDSMKLIHMRLQNTSKVVVNYEWVLIDISNGGRKTKGHNMLSRDNASIDQIVDILPIKSTILPSEKESVEMTMYGSINNKFQGTLLCQVEGGPDYTFQISGESSHVSYQLDRNIVNFGKVLFFDHFDQEITLTNNGKVNFSFHFSFNSSIKDILEILPATGTIAMNQSLKIVLRVYPSIPQYVYDSVNLHIGHFDPIPIYIFCQGIHVSVIASLPRYKRLDPLDTSILQNNLSANQLMNSNESLNKKDKWVDFEEQIYNNIYKFKFIDKFISSLKTNMISSTTASPPEFIDLDNQIDNQQHQPLDKQLTHLINNFIDNDLMKEVDKLKENKRKTTNLPVVDIEMQRSTLFHIINNRLNIHQFEKLTINSSPRNDNQIDKVEKRFVNSYQNAILRNISIETINLSNYFIDFGNVIFGQSKRRYFKLTNTSISTALSFSVDSKSLTTYGYSIEPNQINKLKENESVDFTVKYFAKTNQKGGKMISYLPIYIYKGMPYINLVLSVNVCMPDIDLSMDSIDFSRVEIGRSKSMYITLFNPSPVITSWSMRRLISNTSKSNTLNSYANNLIISPIDGSLKPGKKILICVEFIPSDSKRYTFEYTIKVENNPKPKTFMCYGEGSYLPIKIDPIYVSIGPIMPYQIEEKILTITNPNDEDIEIYSVDFDKLYLQEDTILSNIVDKYDSYGFVRSDIRIPGSGLGHQIISYYNASNNSKTNEIFSLDVNTETEINESQPNNMIKPIIALNNQSNPRYLNQNQDIFVVGPPISGITTLCNKLSQKLNLPIVTIDKLIDDILQSDSNIGKMSRRIFNKSTYEETEEINKKVNELTLNMEKSKELAIETYKKQNKKKSKEIPAEILQTPEVLQYNEYMSDGSISINKLIDIINYRLTWSDLTYGMILQHSISNYMTTEQFTSTISQCLPNIIICNLLINDNYSQYISKLEIKKNVDLNNFVKDINDIQLHIYRLTHKVNTKSNKSSDKTKDREFDKSISYSSQIINESDIEKVIPNGDESWYNESSDSIAELDSQDIKSLDEDNKLVYYKQLLYYKYNKYLNIVKDIDRIKDLNTQSEYLYNNNSQSDDINDKNELKYDNLDKKSIINKFTIQPSYSYDKYTELLQFIDSFRNQSNSNVSENNIENNSDERPETSSMQSKRNGVFDIPVDISDNDDETFMNAMVLLPPPLVKQPDKDSIPPPAIQQIYKRPINRAQRKLNKFLSILRAKIEEKVAVVVETTSDINFNNKVNKSNKSKDVKLNSPRNNKTDIKTDIPILVAESEQNNVNDDSSLKVIIDESISNIDPNYYRWIIPSKQSVHIIIRYTTPIENKFDNYLTFEVVGTLQSFQVNVTGICEVPTIQSDPRNVFMRRIKTFPINYPSTSQIYSNIDRKTSVIIDSKSSSKIEAKADSKTDILIDLSPFLSTVPPDRKYILNQNIYSFGALGVYKQPNLTNLLKSDYTDPSFTNFSSDEIKSMISSLSLNTDIIRITNIGHFAASIDIYLEDLSNELTNIFNIEPKSLVLNEYESKDITIYAFPKELKLYINKLIICVKNNPTPIIYPLMCIGTTIEIQFTGSWDQTIKEAEELISQCKDKKLVKDFEAKLVKLKESLPIDFSRILINKEESKVIKLTSNSLIPIAWAIELNELSDFDLITISPLNGVLDSKQSVDITIVLHCREINIINKKFNIVYSDNDGGLLYPSFNRIQSKSFQIIAEIYNIQAISLLTNKLTNVTNQQLLTTDSYMSSTIDFGLMRVGDIATSTIKLGNKGKYKIKYTILLKNNLDKYISLDSLDGFIEPVNTTSKDPYGNSIQDIQITIRSNDNELILKSNNDMIINIIEPLTNEIVEKFTITISCSIIYNKFRISPSKCLNFGAIRFLDPSSNVSKNINTKSIELKNEGVFSFTYIIMSSILEYDELDTLDNQSLLVYAYNVPPGRRNKELGESYLSKLKKKPTSATKKNKVVTNYLLNNPLVIDPDHLSYDKLPNDPLVVGAYTINPRIGVLEPGQRVTIDVSFNPLICEIIKEKLRICISGIDPNDSYSISLKSFDIIGESCLPAIIVNEPKSIFEEQELVESIYDNTSIPVGKVLYATNEKILGFGPVLCNASPNDVNKANFERIKITNPTKIDINVKFSIQPLDYTSKDAQLSNKNKNKSKKSEKGFSEELTPYLGYQLQPSSWDIPPHEYRYINLYFNPIEMKTYKAICLCEVDYGNIIIESSIPNLNNGRLLTFQLQGTGTLPCITIDEPTDRLSNGQLQIDFGKLHIDRRLSKKIIINNNGILPATCLFEYTGQNVDQFEFLYIDKSITVEPGKKYEIDVSFIPKEGSLYGDKNANIKISVLQNFYDFYNINLYGYSYAFDAIIDTISLEQESIKYSNIVNYFHMIKSDEIYFSDINLTYNQTQSNYKVSLISRCDQPIRFLCSSTIENISFKPMIGHLYPNKRKDILLAFTSLKPLKLEQIYLYAKLKRIEFTDFSTVNNFENGWDDSYSISRVATEEDIAIINNYQTNLLEYQTKYEQAVKSKNKKAIQALGNPLEPCKLKLGEIENNQQLVYETIEEPKYTDLSNQIETTNTKNSISVPLSQTNQIVLPCFGAADYIKVSCNSSVIDFPKTYLYQSSKYSIIYKNECSLYLPINWIFYNKNKKSNSIDNSIPLPIGISRGRGLLDQEPNCPFRIDQNEKLLEPNSTNEFVVTFNPIETDNYSYELNGYINVGDVNKLNANDEISKVNISVNGLSVQPLYHFDIPNLSTNYLSNRSTELKNENGIVSPIEITNLKVIEIQSIGLTVSNIVRFNIINPTAKSYDFIWESIGDPSIYWRVLIANGTVDSNNHTEMSFEYNPNDINISESFYKFSIPSHNIVEYFLFAGSVNEPLVSFHTSKINFNQILLGTFSQEIIYINNNESVPFQFNFMKNSYNSGIIIDPIKGTIPASSKLPIVITFKPVEELLYNFNVLCDIKRKPKPISINIKGEGYNVHPSVSIESKLGSDNEKSHDRFIPIRSKPTVNIVDFGIVQTNDSICKTIKISNNGKYSFDYNWDVSNLTNSLQFIGSTTGTLIKSNELIYQLIYTPNKKETIGATNYILLNISNKYYYKLLIQGSSIAPLIRFSFLSYDFGNCYITSPGGTLVSESINLVINNNDLSNNITLECTFAKTRALWIDNYQPTVLEPGQSVSLNINFAPREVKDYQFVIPFTVNNTNRYNVSIKGKGISTRVELVDTSNYNLNFGTINNNQSKTKSFDIINRGKKQISLELIDIDNVLTNEKCISYIPTNSFILKPKATKTIEIIFNPSNRRIPTFANDLFISYGGLIRSLVKISGKAQGVDLALDTDMLSFGIVVQGSKKSKKLLLENKGDISIQYQWDNQTFGKHFTISPLMGKLSPGNEVSFDVVFEPKIIDDDIRQDDIILRILGQPTPLLLTCNGLCISQPTDMISTVSFESKARKSENKSVKISNSSDKDWYLSPVLDGEHWIIPNEVKVPANSSIDMTISYYPLVMSKTRKIITPMNSNPSSKDNKINKKSSSSEKLNEIELIPQEGQIFIPLPDGTVLLYNLLGYSYPPESSGLISIETPAKVPISKSITIANWLSSKSQEFTIKTEITEMPSIATSIICFNVIELLPNATKELPIRFQSYCEGTTKAKITLTNEKTGEYMYYDILAKTTMAEVLDTISIESPIRQISRSIITIENPLSTNNIVNMLDEWYTCDNPNIQLVELTPLSSNHEGNYEIQYRPLSLASTTSLLSIHTKELGSFKYKLQLNSTNNQIKQVIKFTDISLGSLAVEYLPIPIYNRNKCEYTCIIKNNPNIFIVNKSIMVDSVSNFDGDTLKIKISFDPINIGELNDILIITSNEGSEYMVDIYGKCISPIPQGPYTFNYIPNSSSSKSTNSVIGVNLQEIMFRNCYPTNLQYNITCDNPNYRIIVTTKDSKDAVPSLTIPSKSEGKFSILFDPSGEVVSSNNDNVINGKVMITCPSKSELLPWIYYLRGSVNIREQTPLTPTKKK